MREKIFHDRDEENIQITEENIMLFWTRDHLTGDIQEVKTVYTSTISVVDLLIRESEKPFTYEYPKE